MKKLNFEQFEQLTENAEGQLISGFSEAFEGNFIMGGGDTAASNLISCHNTNCSGGNCVAGCGSH
ncbi:hypothetical protein FAM09_10725 [Niastella caeni]|uniref:Uncharacterized protein n=1 Tax=Niastella caeni TaxID=2569763 RepID=A0A4S8HX90_9BACT|nr:hypothetical protein [Niastella caeni]THU40333.1 hypothetical protein FAM09_10725 [Niastella caeni]